ncbi:GntR family transcriptional regulator [Streptomyces sp. NPDC057486]|uniref:GntR family transcriptional regulator n=1 Tax=Streptomyces sp. NPDC057486 TaxID=3346145 RepID=UPI0036B9159D
MASAPGRLILAETVYDMIRQRLVSHEIEPGTKLNINGLAAELDVSPTPVREALARLESDGLVVKRSLAGYTAAPLMTSADFGDLFEMRLLLEPVAAARAATRITADDLLALEGHLREMRRVQHDASRETLRLFFLQDALFHARIANAVGNALMADTLRRFHAHAHLYRLHFREESAEATCVEHERILEALRESDPDISAAAMRSHIRRARQRLLPALGDADHGAPDTDPTQDGSYDVTT